ncbi:hypothetical protein BKA83DRAFT_689574 [Pisolithus microcarpus]|nr:hypothetical protein BKA83DRAFT_689574 [Pisolithus microcarpus]
MSDGDLGVYLRSPWGERMGQFDPRGLELPGRVKEKGGKRPKMRPKSPKNDLDSI